MTLFTQKKKKKKTPGMCGITVMDKCMNTENTQKIFISGFPSFQIPYFPKRSILDKEELILNKEGEILSLGLRDFLKSRGELANHFL